MKCQFIKYIPFVVIAALSLGVVFYSIKFGVGSLYTKAVENELGVLPASIYTEDARKSLDQKNQFTNSMLSWNSESPHSLVLAGYFQFYLGGLSGDDELIRKGTEYVDQSAALRPLWPEPYIQRAYMLENLGAPLVEVVENVERAAYVGPYEKSTAQAILNIYFANWLILETPQRIEASKVVLRSEDYGIRQWRLRQFINKSPYKQRICNLLKFNGIAYKECKLNR